MSTPYTPVNPFHRAQRPSRPSNDIWQVLVRNSGMAIFVFVLLHVLLGIAATQSSAVAMIHSLLTLAVGLCFAVSSQRIERVVWVCAYLISSEVLWRMTQGLLFYEFGKYALVAILLTAILRNGMFRASLLPVFYFMLLLPSVVIPMANIDSSKMRMYVSFNLSGPFALMVSVWFLSQIRLRSRDYYRALLAMIAPIAALAAAAAFRLAINKSAYFGRSSNYAASGGFGPNQVSATLGLGILAAILYLLLERRELMIKVFLALTAIWFGVQSALTLSRTGLYLAGISTVAGALFLIRDGQTRIKLAFGAAAFFLILVYVVLPVLEDYTKGAVAARFQNVALTGRETILKEDLDVWAKNPVFGIGPGLVAAERSDEFRDTASHTEFTRLLAEHGLFGLLSLFMMIAMSILHFRRAQNYRARALVFSLLCWSFLFMSGTGMRLAAPAFIFGLTAITIRWPDPADNPRSPQFTKAARASF